MWRMPEMWRRIVLATTVHDFASAAHFFPWSWRFWHTLWWRLVAGPIFVLLRDRLHIWWVPEGDYYVSGFWVTPREWWRFYYWQTERL